MLRFRQIAKLLPLLTLAVPAAPIRAAEFPPITERQRALTAIPGQPGTPAVVLFKKGVLRIMDYPQDRSSRLDMQVRLKILTEEGKRAYGEVAVSHSRAVRLTHFEGRTVLGGRVVPLSEDAVFREERSQAKKRYLTKAAFPAVEVGAIIDYRYTLHWDDFAGLEPWLFHHRIPTLLSEITYQKPANLSLDPWFKETAGGKIQMESHRTPRGVELRARMEDLIAIPDEPYGFPFADLSSRFMIVPKEFTLDGTRRLRLFDSWENAFAGFGENYARFRRDGSRARKQASTVVAAGGANSRRDRMTAVFAFVRDEIRTLPSAWVGVTDRSADQVLAERQGDHVGKALLLRTMLEAVKTKTRLVWAADKSDGRVYLDVANPWWFERVLVLVEVDGERIFLDPSDRRLGFGRLAPHYEGTQALIPHSRRSEIITLPLSPSEGNVRRAVVGLRLDGEGRLTGTGTLVLNGHHAWRRLRWQEDVEQTTDAWRDWLANAYEGYEVSDVEVNESLDEQQVRVAWSLAQRQEEVLGDETSVVPSLPLGPVKQPFALPPERRLTPVQLPFGDRHEVEMTLTWPAGWEIDVLPEAASFQSHAGALASQIEVDGSSRRLTYRRRFDVSETEFIGPQGYAVIRDLYQEVEKCDAQNLVLVRR